MFLRYLGNFLFLYIQEAELLEHTNLERILTRAYSAADLTRQASSALFYHRSHPTDGI